MATPSYNSLSLFYILCSLLLVSSLAKTCVNNCNGHGTCNTIIGLCDCVPGWTGDFCDESAPICPNNCNGHGICQNVDGTPKCMCQSGYGGDDCSSAGGSGGGPVSTTGCYADCSNRGTCKVETQQCACQNGWGGEICTEPGPSPNVCPNQCSGNGFCSYNPATKTSHCLCNPGYNSADCSNATCPNGCSGHGQCDESVPMCNCDAGWGQADCSQNVVTAEDYQISKDGSSSNEPYVNIDVDIASGNLQFTIDVPYTTNRTWVMDFQPWTADGCGLSSGGACESQVVNGNGGEVQTGADSITGRPNGKYVRVVKQYNIEDMRKQCVDRNGNSVLLLAATRQPSSLSIYEYFTFTGTLFVTAVRQQEDPEEYGILRYTFQFKNDVGRDLNAYTVSSSDNTVKVEVKRASMELTDQGNYCVIQLFTVAPSRMTVSRQLDRQSWVPAMVSAGDPACDKSVKESKGNNCVQTFTFSSAPEDNGHLLSCMAEYKFEFNLGSAKPVILAGLGLKQKPAITDSAVQYAISVVFFTDAARKSTEHIVWNQDRLYAAVRVEVPDQSNDRYHLEITNVWVCLGNDSSYEPSINLQREEYGCSMPSKYVPANQIVHLIDGDTNSNGGRGKAVSNNITRPWQPIVQAPYSGPLKRGWETGFVFTVNQMSSDKGRKYGVQVETTLSINNGNSRRLIQLSYGGSPRLRSNENMRNLQASTGIQPPNAGGSGKGLVTEHVRVMQLGQLNAWDQLSEATKNAVIATATIGGTAALVGVGFFIRALRRRA
eukprot:GILK01016079.1.p1 GENE.GILK01016079.1~~GILK01016079.1.p1  ORF type:complete len:773 (-),score=80.13 GILK01016079.1:152-2470(-)